jgi:metal-sulfur cluster biosynthetic enzyme
MVTSARVLQALAEVHDPEVDQPVTDMGFIREVVVDDGEVVVHMQLPTYFCAPNFTYLMVEDVRRAAEAVAGGHRVRVELDGHFESAAINRGAAGGQGFAEVFAGQATEDLDAIRDRFGRKTFLIRQEHVCRELESAGVRPGDLASLCLADVESYAADSYARYLTTREELGIDCRPGAQFLVAADGRPVGPEQIRTHRRSASVLAISFEGNGHLCRSLIAERYPQLNNAHQLQGDVA